MCIFSSKGRYLSSKIKKMGGGEYPLLWGPALALNPSAEREVVWVGGWWGGGGDGGAYYLFTPWTMLGPFFSGF